MYVIFVNGIWSYIVLHFNQSIKMSASPHSIYWCQNQQVLLVILDLPCALSIQPSQNICCGSLLSLLDHQARPQLTLGIATVGYVLVFIMFKALPWKILNTSLFRNYSADSRKSFYLACARMLIFTVKWYDSSHFILFIPQVFSARQIDRLERWGTFQKSLYLRQDILVQWRLWGLVILPQYQNGNTVFFGNYQEQNIKNGY